LKICSNKVTVSVDRDIVTKELILRKKKSPFVRIRNYKYQVNAKKSRSSSIKQF
jgi:hypothetical protein